MSSLPALAITGSTGQLGGAVARILADAGVAQRLLVRDHSRARQLPGAEAVLVNYSDTTFTQEALAGAKTLFFVSAAEAEDRLQQHFNVVDAAAAAGVEHMVYTSFFGAAPDATFTLGRDHYATEEHIRNSGMAYTFLRDNFYIDFFAALAGEDGVIRGPAGSGTVAAVTRADVAEVAAVVLQNPSQHRNRTYSLTGPEELTLGEVAEILSAETGQQVRYHNETVDEAYESRASYSAPPWQLDAWVSTYTAIANGELSGTTTDVFDITGHRPRSLREFLQDEGQN
ncbi:SDR family oxidoreductase [Pseudarthrobacter sp. J1738]|uniref:SDR family oxidoreductase n=1 Tax=Pseudarthrobacter sp. J1738 TaxID=3420446 RepID=UPI003D2C1382